MKRFLMCEPRFFEVSYAINPWMEGNLGRVDRALARRQWENLCNIVSKQASMSMIEPVAGLPDMVFTANAALVRGRSCVLARFRHEERQGEEPYFAEWFLEKGYAVHRCGPELYFEGAGDALFDRAAPLLWMGYGHRSVAGAQNYVAALLTAAGDAVEVVTLELIDARFYHLDTCFCPLEGGFLLYYPPAFSAASLLAIEARVPAHRRIACDAGDALAFACNAINIDTTLIVNHLSDTLADTLAARGFTVEQTDLTEFMKAGGAAKCLTLALE